MVNEISNQTVHHQSATTSKFAFMLEDIKNYKPVKLLKYCISDIAQRNQ